MKRRMFIVLLSLLALTSTFSLAADVTAEKNIKGAFTATNTGIAPANCPDQQMPLLAAAACGGNLACGYNTGCAPGRTACCPRSAPNLNMCNCRCYARRNYNTSKGGCNVWHSCR